MAITTSAAPLSPGANIMDEIPTTLPRKHHRAYKRALTALSAGLSPEIATDIVLELAARWPQIFVELHHKATTDLETRTAVYYRMNGGKKIATIKQVRHWTGMGLKDAKEFVEATVSRHGLDALIIRSPLGR
jgi:hypothetical protein